MSRKESSYALGHIVEELTQGNPYVFVVMPYKSRWDFFVHLRVGAASGGLAAIRADDVHGAGHDLLAKIHLLIERAELVIAEISTPSANVFYEVGYAVGMQKPLLLFVEEGVDVPTDLKGREVITYGGSREAMEVFDKRLEDHLRSRVNSQIALLRDMLEADIPTPAYIVASPRYPGKDTRIRGQVYDQRTFGDNLGVLGLISAFGCIMGEGHGVELVSGQYCPPDLLSRPLNLYLIGSPKSNPPVRQMLQRLQKGCAPNWILGAIPGEKEEGDYRTALYRTRGGKIEMVKGRAEHLGMEKALVHVMDHGIIVRGPHPDYPGRLAMVLARPHSLGTGAACLAATRSPLIQQIKSALPAGVDIADKRRTLWVLVRGEISQRDALLDLEGVSVLEAEVYE
ncbi:MAG: hypothetical protein ACUVR2_09490 [Anaerolineae bacterium]